VNYALKERDVFSQELRQINVPNATKNDTLLTLFIELSGLRFWVLLWGF
jgi:hypothetical protein